jgi:hypothetical protein
LENVAEFKYLGMTLTNKNLICEGAERRLNSREAGLLATIQFRIFLSSRLLKNAQVKGYKL